MGSVSCRAFSWGVAKPGPIGTPSISRRPGNLMRMPRIGPTVVGGHVPSTAI